MKKIICNVASYNRTESLLKSISSIYNQVDIINVSLNDFKTDIPKELIDDKINLIFTDNSRGDGFKFINLINSDGYFLTIDDDLIYPNDYVKYMIEKCNQYQNKSIITLHGRNFGKLPIQSYYGSAKEIYSCLRTVNNDVKVQYGGTGVMCFDTDLFKIGIEYFQYPNMADVWIGKYAKEHNIPIICAKHNQNYIQYIPQKETIFDTESKKDLIQTKIVNNTRLIDLSIIIPTYNNENYLDECLNSIIKSIKNLDCEILIGVDNCQKTMEKIKKQKFDSRVKIFYFNKNLGPYIIKNTLVKESNSDYILFFDSDDIMNENMISEIYPKIKQVDFIKPMYLDFKDGQKITSVTKTNKYGEGVFAIKKSLFLQMNGFEPWRCAADSDFMGRLYKNNKKFVFTSDVVFFRRVHSNSLTQNPETSSWSKLRAQYYKISKSKKTFGPLPTLVTETFERVFVESIFNKELPIFQIKNEKNNDALNKIELNPNKSKPVNYDAINQVVEKRGVYIPTSNPKPVRENKPNDRNKLQELKKNGENRQAIEKLFKSKPNRRNGLPNIF
jgi:glycosyltransferase involved in cell wall biosynthesis